MKILNINFNKPIYSIQKPQNPNYTNKTSSIQQIEDSFSLSFKGKNEATPLFDKMPSFVKKLATNTADYYKKHYLSPKNKPLFKLSTMKEKAKKDKSKNNIINLSHIATLKAKKLFIEAVDTNNKDKMQEASKHFAFALNMRLELDSITPKTTKSEGRKLSKALDLARVYIIINDTSNAEMILDYFMKNVNEESLKQYKPTFAALKDNLGKAHFHNKDYEKAIKSSSQSVELYEKENMIEASIDPKINLGRTYILNKEPDKALEILNEAKDYYQKAQNTKGLLKVQSYIAMAYFKKEDFKIAIELNKEILEHSNLFTEQKFLGLTEDHLGECYLKDKQYDNALKHFKNALNIRGRDFLSLSFTHANISNTYYKIGYYEKALEHKVHSAFWALKSKKGSLKHKNIIYLENNLKYSLPYMENSKYKQALENLDFENKNKLKSQLENIIKTHLKGQNNENFQRSKQYA